mgnify:CR=1 FL=1
MCGDVAVEEDAVSLTVVRIAGGSVVKASDNIPEDAGAVGAWADELPASL